MKILEKVRLFQQLRNKTIGLLAVLATSSVYGMGPAEIVPGQEYSLKGDLNLRNTPPKNA